MKKKLFIVALVLLVANLAIWLLAKPKPKLSPQELHELAEMYEKQWDKYLQAVELYQKAAEQGYAPSQNTLAYCYFEGVGVAVNESEAIKWLRKSAEQAMPLRNTDLVLVMKMAQGWRWTRWKLLSGTVWQPNRAILKRSLTLVAAILRVLGWKRIRLWLLSGLPRLRSKKIWLRNTTLGTAMSMVLVVP